MERFALGLSTTVIGMLVVFIGLVILIACIYVMTSITGRKSKAKAPAAPETRVIPAAPAPAPAAQEEQAAQEQEDNGAVVAAISAAIALILEKENHAGGFVVRRIRRCQNSTARARAARDEQMFSRL